ncbi:hypothetical protein Syun_020798 [Stephania yunnanensis]|uniref:Uncharacterized protein n=1 Tax=Stephania yunnanensis TaxID=152371 RepID=A0AAP0IFS6_9MAGN
MADARAKVAEEAQLADDEARFVGYEVFLEEVFADEVLIEETRSVTKPRPTQESVVGDSNSVEPSISSNNSGEGMGSERGRGKGSGRATILIPFAPLR